MHRKVVFWRYIVVNARFYTKYRKRAHNTASNTCGCNFQTHYFRRTAEQIVLPVQGLTLTFQSKESKELQTSEIKESQQKARSPSELVEMEMT